MKEGNVGCSQDPEDYIALATLAAKGAEVSPSVTQAAKGSRSWLGILLGVPQ